MTLTQEQIDHFNREGYLKYGKVLEDEQVEVLREPRGECALPFGGAQRATGVDHALARFFDALVGELLAQHVGKRHGVEAALLEKAHDLALAGPVET